MANKSKSNHQKAVEEDNSTEVEIEEDTEEEETMDSEVEIVEIEDPEEISVTDQRAVSTVAKKVTLPETAANVNDLINLSEKTKRIQQRQTRQKR